MDLDYAPPQRPFIAPRLTTLVCLVIGLILYWVLCGPAINQRGYPPLDAWWMGMIWLWIFPPILTALVEPKNLIRFLFLALYAIATAWVEARTVVDSVPRSIDLHMSVLRTIFHFGPIHLAVVIIAEFIAQLVINRTGCSVIIIGYEKRRMRPIWKTWFAAILVIFCAVATPWTYAAWDRARLQRWGVQQADQDWADRKSSIYQNMTLEPQAVDRRITVFTQYDRSTGLKTQFDMLGGYGQAYNEETLRLIATKGKPSWAFKGDFVPPDVVAAVFLHGKLSIATTLPFNPTPDIAVSYTTGLVVKGHFDSMQDQLPSTLPVYCGRVTDIPSIIFIKHGNQLMWVMTDDGRILLYAHGNKIER